MATRRLSSFDQAVTITDRFAPFNVVIALVLENGPPAETMGQAVAGLAKRHPLLRARLTGRQSFHIEAEASVRSEEIDRAGEDQWREVVERELNRRFDTGRAPLFRAVWLVDSADRAVREAIFTFHHSIIDGASAANLINEVLSLGQALTEGHEADWLEPLDPAPPMNDLLPDRFRGPGLMPRLAAFMGRQALDEIRFRKLARGGRKPPIHDSGQGRILPLRLGREATAGLVNRARRERVSINSALSAAMLLAVHRRLYDGQPTGLRNFVFNDLRPNLAPAVAPENLGCYISMGRYTNPVDPETDLWDLGRTIQAQVHAAFKWGEPYLNALTAKRLMKMLIGLKAFRMGATALSYNGLPRLEATHGPTSLTDIHCFISNNVLGPEFSGQASIWNGRLNLDLLYLDSDMNRTEAEAIGREMIGLLGDG